LRPAEPRRDQQRRTAERVIAGFRDNVAGRVIRVRGPDKLTCHLRFGRLAPTAIQIMRLAQ
jgi:hypothetical protein